MLVCESVKFFSPCYIRSHKDGVYESSVPLGLSPYLPQGFGCVLGCVETSSLCFFVAGRSSRFCTLNHRNDEYI